MRTTKFFLLLIVLSTWGITCGQTKKLSTTERFKKEYANKNPANEVIFYAYIADPEPNPTNIRVIPGGKVVKTISKDEACAVSLIEVWNGWFRISATIEIDGEDFTLPTKQAWVHGSVLGAVTRSYDSVKGTSIGSYDAGYPILYAHPDVKSKTVYTIMEEEASVSYIDMVEGWIKVRYINSEGEKHVGWIEAVWLCTNPLTTCP